MDNFEMDQYFDQADYEVNMSVLPHIALELIEWTAKSFGDPRLEGNHNAFARKASWEYSYSMSNDTTFPVAWPGQTIRFPATPPTAFISLKFKHKWQKTAFMLKWSEYALYANGYGE